MKRKISDEKVVSYYRAVIHMAVRMLALLMTIVIFFGVLDVGWVLYEKLTAEPFMLLTISDILATFGAFMAVLIAIEIFENIIIYLREDIIHVKIVMATALMAIARKVIILDFKTTEPAYIYATAAVVLAMSIGRLTPLLYPSMSKAGPLGGRLLTYQSRIRVIPHR